MTTHGALAISSYQLSQPYLQRLDEAGISANAGFGVDGRAGAEQLARRALHRAQAHSGSTAVVSFRNNIDLVLGAGAGGTAAAGVPCAGHSRDRIGVALQTSRIVAEALDVQLRTPGRCLHPLERGGWAKRAGNEARESSGRPLTQYLLRR